MAALNVGVIGAGYLGKFHAEKYAALDNCNLAGIVDIDQQTALSVAEKFPTASAFSDYASIIDQVDAVSIVTSTPTHYAIAKDFLLQRKHVLLEKPMTSNEEQAQELIKLAEQNNSYYRSVILSASIPPC